MREEWKKFAWLVVCCFFSFFVPFCTFSWLNRQPGWLRVGSRETWQVLSI
jgi:hypothetical protein